ncbi:alpha/beta hydrolase [Cnuibacter sp. UC19_7]|uniref:alpha/beta hydrolase n=1 Tax=Cnuibacter sp. UC19_7 TaxID=3350166 RepID=UPI00366CB553
MTGFWARVLDIRIVDGPVLIAVYAVAVVFLLAIVVRRPAVRWVRPVAIAFGAGAVCGVLLTVLVQNVLDVFNTPMSVETRIWIAAVFATMSAAVASAVVSHGWRRIVSLIAVPVFALTTAIGINADFGIDKTLGDFLDIETLPALDLSALPPHSTNPDGPLVDSWTPPADMPDEALVGTVEIPTPASDFDARDAVVYLPPAAQVANAPALPVVVYMGGQPGSPAVDDVGQVLDEFTEQTDGLAPIVVSVDQLGGDGSNNPLCIDGYQGNAATYVNDDVVSFIRSTFNVMPGPAAWSIAGFSNGGGCAIRFGALHPDVWGSVIDISGELGPSLGSEQDTIDEGFGGDADAYRAQLPLTILDSRTYPSSKIAIFTVGQFDGRYVRASQEIYEAAEAAGMTAYRFVSPGTGHEAATIQFGFAEAFDVLFPVWGLSPADPALPAPE